MQKFSEQSNGIMGNVKIRKIKKKPNPHEKKNCYPKYTSVNFFLDWLRFKTLRMLPPKTINKSCDKCKN